MQAAKIYKCHPDAIIPEVKSRGAAGYDLHAIEDFTIEPGDRAIVGTGLVVQPPRGYHTEIILRSGLAYKHNIMLVNGIGLIDRDYSGETDELKVMLYLPLGEEKEVSFEKGDRVAQLVFRMTYLPSLVEVDEAPGETRGGFGSTGK